jgi:hypothetical protein
MRRSGWTAAVLAFSIFAIPQVTQAKRVALVVGINRYDNLPHERQLVKAVNDARAMEGALKAVGFDVIKAEDVGRSAFNQAWQQLLNKDRSSGGRCHIVVDSSETASQVLARYMQQRGSQPRGRVTFIYTGVPRSAGWSQGRVAASKGRSDHSEGRE